MDDNAVAGAAVGGVMGLLIVLAVGLVVGIVAKLLMPGRDPGGWFVTALLGVAGSWVGSFILGLFGLSGQLPAILGAIGGAVLLLVIYRQFKKS